MNFGPEAIVSLIATLMALVVFLLMLEESIALTAGRDPITNDVRSAVVGVSLTRVFHWPGEGVTRARRNPVCSRKFGGPRMPSLKLCAHTHRPKRRNAGGDPVDYSYDFSKRRSLNALKKRKPKQSSLGFSLFILEKS